ncbi:head scaffolding protein [Aeromonas phage GomatiRiver_11]|nr:prohead assembly protein [Aeromonas phage AhFM11]WBF04175.1 head scaffolding protein [Aeromonas phage GomatiRiver_11]
MRIPADYSVDISRVTGLLESAAAHVQILSDFTPEERLDVISKLSESETDLALAMISIVESTTIEEAIVKHVNSRGEITRKKDRATRKRNAFNTTGLTASTRRQIARRAAKTKRANPSINVKAQRKTKRALKRRKALGL